MNNDQIFAPGELSVFHVTQSHHVITMLQRWWLEAEIIVGCEHFPNYRAALPPPQD